MSIQKNSDFGANYQQMQKMVLELNRTGLQLIQQFYALQTVMNECEGSWQVVRKYFT